MTKTLTSFCKGSQLPSVKSIAQRLGLELVVRKSFLQDRYTLTFYGTPSAIDTLSKVLAQHGSPALAKVITIRMEY